MIPLYDSNPTERTPVVTITFIVVNVLVFVYEWSLTQQGQLFQFFDTFAIVPTQLLNNFGAESFTLITAMFLHGSWTHLGGNMLYLWIFGNNIEDRLGHGRFIAFYVVCGLAASAAQIVIDPASQVPNVGASGAIAGVLGGYLLLFPRARVTTLVFRFITQVPAYLVLGFWFILQLFQGAGSLATVGAQTGGVAFFAHIGGFVAGMILIRPFSAGRSKRYDETYW